MEARRLSVRFGWRSDAGYGWRTASRLISKRISPGARLSAIVDWWFQARPRSSRLRVLPAVKTARWPPRGRQRCRVRATGLLILRMVSCPARSPRLPYRLVRPGRARPPGESGGRAAMGCRYPRAAGRLVHVWSWWCGRPLRCDLPPYGRSRTRGEPSGEPPSGEIGPHGAY